jgi:hypothetical protein
LPVARTIKPLQRIHYLVVLRVASKPEAGRAQQAGHGGVPAEIGGDQ